MEYSFLLTCFFVGILAASGIGPIFILTFNKSALHGFWYGFVTACAAAVVDAIFFFLALIGVLSAIKDSSKFIIVFDFLGGVLLFFLGARMVYATGDDLQVTTGRKENLLFTFSRAFFLTLLNPLTMLFFMVTSLKILPDNAATFSKITIILASSMVAFSTLLVLSLVSFVAMLVGHKISTHILHLINVMTGIIFIIVAFYLFGCMIYELVCIDALIPIFF